MRNTTEIHSTQLHETMRSLYHPRANEASAELRSAPRNRAGRAPDAAELQTSPLLTSIEVAQR